MVTVALGPAYVWDCDECGHENFQRPASVILNPADKGDARKLRRMHDIKDGEPIPDGCCGWAYAAPNRVTCRRCGAEFRAVDADHGNE